MSYSIRQLSQEFDVTPRTLRFYEEKGLLSPKREGNNRVYQASDRTRLKLILRGKRLGLSLEESGEIIQMYDPQSNNVAQLESLISTIRSKRTQLAEQLDDLKRMIEELQEFEDKSKSALNQLKNH